MACPQGLDHFFAPQVKTAPPIAFSSPPRPPSAAPVVGLLAQGIFSFDGTLAEMGSLTPTAHLRHNAEALGNALLVCLEVPWALCLVFYSLLHLTYHRDRECARAVDARVAGPVVEELAEGARRSPGGGSWHGPRGYDAGPRHAQEHRDHPHHQAPHTHLTYGSSGTEGHAHAGPGVARCSVAVLPPRLRKNGNGSGGALS